MLENSRRTTLPLFQEVSTDIKCRQQPAAVAGQLKNQLVSVIQQPQLMPLEIVNFTIYSSHNTDAVFILFIYLLCCFQSVTKAAQQHQLKLFHFYISMGMKAYSFGQLLDMRQRASGLQSKPFFSDGHSQCSFKNHKSYGQININCTACKIKCNVPRTCMCTQLQQYKRQPCLIGESCTLREHRRIMD